MPTYFYKGRNRLNKVVSGKCEATSPEDLRQLLRREQIVMISASDKQNSVSFPKQKKQKKKKKVKSSELVVFTEKFSKMVYLYSLVECIDILARQQQNAFLRKVLNQVCEDVETGSTLAVALGKHPNVFDNIYISMIEAGETGGVLDIVLYRLKILNEKMIKLNRMHIPMLFVLPMLIVLIIVLLVAIVTALIPGLSKSFAGFVNSVIFSEGSKKSV